MDGTAGQSPAAPAVPAGIDAPAQPAQAAQPAQQVGSEAPAWARGVTPENQAWLGSKQYASLDAVLEAGRHAERFIGAPPNEILRVPGTDANEDARREAFTRFHARLSGEGSYPKDVAGYEMPDPAAGEVDLRGLLPILHKHGASKALVTEAYQALRTHAQEQAQVQQQAQAQAYQQAYQQLRAEWGAEADVNEQYADIAMESLAQVAPELTKEAWQKARNALGLTGAPFLKALAAVGRSLAAEPQLHGGEGPKPLTLGMTPEAAREMIRTKYGPGSEGMKRLERKDPEAMREWDELGKAIGGADPWDRTETRTARLA